MKRTMLLDLDHDRRSEPRVSLTRPCKLFDPRARSYISGTTCNLSCDGMLLRLHRTSNLHVGDRVYVGISRKRQQVLLVSSEMLEAVVVRVLRPGMGEMLVAVRWLSESPAVPLSHRSAA
jgi:hypothetical protein